MAGQPKTEYYLQKKTPFTLGAKQRILAQHPTAVFINEEIGQVAS